ncbi:MAG: hypothetical protein OXM03_12405 [Chloroflexota bacterium]|nr:hypothetical protein [Chloroflexota bacterium]MDE2841420.1 hypothetical protein [Chloroflexota bacterium]MDE2929667.1 hypothetical protein [Chloroflexota bacterium]
MAETANTGSRLDTNLWLRVPQALCLVLFPLSFLLLSNTGLHPGYAGTPAEQIRGLAADAGRWQLVHAGLAGGSLLGLGAILTLRSLLPRPRTVASVITAFGVVATSVLTGIFMQEAMFVPELALACVESEAACLSSANQTFVDRFTELSLSSVPLLFQGGALLMVTTFALALIALRSRVLVLRESLPVMVGATVVFLYGPGLHGVPLGLPFIGFLFMLAGFSLLAARILRTP